MAGQRGTKVPDLSTEPSSVGCEISSPRSLTSSCTRRSFVEVGHDLGLSFASCLSTETNVVNEPTTCTLRPAAEPSKTNQTNVEAKVSKDVSLCGVSTQRCLPTLLVWSSSLAGSFTVDERPQQWHQVP